MNTIRAIRPLTLAIATALLVIGGCSRAGAPVAITPEPTVASTPQPQRSTPADSEIAPVSASKPGQEAADVMAKCHIGDGDMVSLKAVTGMGKIASASDLTHYVPFTGREPQLKESGAAWVVQVSGDFFQRDGEVWTNPTCVVTESTFGYFATGPVTLQNGDKVQPEAPASPPDRVLPPLAP